MLRAGGIIEEGNHDALIVQRGYYAELTNTFFRHPSLQSIETPLSVKFQPATAGAVQ